MTGASRRDDWFSSAGELAEDGLNSADIAYLFAEHRRISLKAQSSRNKLSYVVTVDETGRVHSVSSSPETEKATERALDAVSRARARGRRQAIEILDSEEMLTSDEFAEQLGISRQALHKKLRKWEVLGLEGARRGLKFPRWQVSRNGKPFDVLPRLHEALDREPWAVYRFLMQSHAELEGRSALQALMDGQTDTVLQVAETVTRDFS
ncbi:MAG: HTH domain-containing protein [Pseudomonadota bacterium]